MASRGFITVSSDENLSLLSLQLAGAQLQISPGGKVNGTRLYLIIAPFV